jgi:hypothetical protein
MPFVIAALLAWSAFSYGAVYAWAYLPVAAAIVGVGAVVLAIARPRLSIRLPAIAALALGAAIAAQTVPVSAALLGQSNHGARKVLSALDVGYANGVTAAHSLSVDTPATWFGLTAFALLAVWLISTSVVGIPALLLVLAAGRVIVGRLRQPQSEMTWWIRMGAVAGVCGMAAQELTEFSLQIPAVALLFATCVAVAIHQPARIPARRARTERTEALVTSI